MKSLFAQLDKRSFSVCLTGEMSEGEEHSFDLCGAMRLRGIRDTMTESGCRKETSAASGEIGKPVARRATDQGDHVEEKTPG